MFDSSILKSAKFGLEKELEMLSINNVLFMISFGFKLVKHTIHVSSIFAQFRVN